VHAKESFDLDSLINLFPDDAPATLTKRAKETIYNYARTTPVAMVDPKGLDCP
jgi:hypothetical protein